MKYFFTKLFPPRPDFIQTITDVEKDAMRRHAAYMLEFSEKGWAVAYGPVASQHGNFGAGFWAIPDDVDPQPLVQNDPVIQANLGFHYEVSPMPALVVSKSPLQ